MSSADVDATGCTRSTSSEPHPSIGGLTDRNEILRRSTDEISSSPLPTNITSKSSNGKEESASSSDHPFICNICLIAPDQPVVTVCGHLYCWGCLYKWLCLHREQAQCPVCKAGIELPNGEPSKAKVTPLYVNGRTTDPRESSTPEEIPQRPAGERPESQRRFVFPGWQGGPIHHAFGNVTFSAGFGLFPSLFGITFTQGPMGFATRNEAGRRGEVSVEDEAQQEFLSRLLILVGIFIVMCLIFFP